MLDSSSLVLDSSPLINLVASGQAHSILAAFKRPVFVADVTLRELVRNPQGESSNAIVGDLIARETISVVELNDFEVELFFELVAADTQSALGDGESAALSLALSRAYAVVLDDAKARRIGRARSPRMEIASSLDLFRAAKQKQLISSGAFSSALFDALRYARMRVPDQDVRWVAEIIGRDRLRQCMSIKRRLRDTLIETDGSVASCELRPKAQTG